MQRIVNNKDKLTTQLNYNTRAPKILKEYKDGSFFL